MARTSPGSCDCAQDDIGGAAQDDIGGAAQDDIGGAAQDDIGGAAQDDIGGAAQDDIGGAVAPTKPDATRHTGELYGRRMRRPYVSGKDPMLAGRDGGI